MITSSSGGVEGQLLGRGVTRGEDLDRQGGGGVEQCTARLREPGVGDAVVVGFA
jgi:hypothetical protein